MSASLIKEDRANKESKISERLLQAYVLLKRQCLLIHRLVETDTSRKAFEEAFDPKSTKSTHVLDVYNFVLSLIDSLERYRKIANTLPRINKKGQEFRRLLDGLANVEDMRHRIQHINNDIENDFKGHLLGSICWINNDVQYLVSLNDVGRSRNSVSIIYDFQEQKYLNTFCYEYDHEYCDLDKAVKAVTSFDEFLEGYIQIHKDGLPHDITKNFTALRMRFSFSLQPLMEGGLVPVNDEEKS